MDWILVDQVMPADMTEVLAFDEKKGILISYYFKETDCLIGTVDGMRLYHARYWMPLPGLPDTK